ncbi:MAG: hypothetical protein IJM30_03625 [Thermoguttaceae bacterium]|nr:hypothetical protein [Thermoguttaceae bacterium]
MNKTISLLAAILFAFSFSFQNAEAQTCSVANIWEAGEYSLSHESLVSFITSLQKEKRVVDRNQTQVRFFWNASVSELGDDGAQKMTLRATRVILRFESEVDGAAFYDSSNDHMNNEFVKEVFKRFLAAEVAISFRNGEVDSLQVADDIWNGLETKDESEKFFLERFKSLLLKECFRQIFDPLSWVSNPNEVSVNDQWKNETPIDLPELGMVGDQSLTWNCKLNSISKEKQGERANVEATCHLDVDPNENLCVEVKAEIKAKFDAKYGAPIEIESRTTASALKKSPSQEDAAAKIVALQRNKLVVAKH